MSSPNSVATAILANTGQSRNDGLGIETPLTSRSLLSVSIGNATESMASSMISPRTRGRWDRRTSDVESGLHSPTAARPPSSWLTETDDEGSVRSELDTRPFPSFGRNSSIAPDSSFYSQIGRFQGVRNSVSLAQPWRRRKDSTTTGSYTTTTDSEEDGDGDASTMHGSRHEQHQQQQQQEQEQEQEQDAAVDLFSQHQFIMPKPDETTPLIAADDVENNLVSSLPDAGNDPSLASLPHHRSRLLFRLIILCLAGTVVASVLLVVMMRPPASGERKEE